MSKAVALLSSRAHYFLQCAECSSFTEAAKQIGLSQAALSIAMAQLESEVGAKLFARQRRGIALTAQGSKLRALLRETFDRLEQGVPRALGHSEEVALKVGAVAHFGLGRLLPAIDRLKGRLPRVQLALTWSLHSMEAVRHGQLDFAFVAWTSRPMGVKSVEICKDPTGIVGLKTKYPELVRASSRADLRNHPWVVYPKPQYTWTQALRGDALSYVAKDLYAVRELVLSGRGICDVQLDLFTEKEKKRLAHARQVPSHYPNGQIYCVYCDDLPSAAKAHLNLLVSTLKN